jgi:hypothetical protein
MQHASVHVVATTLLWGCLAAQSNTVSGIDGNLYEIGPLAVWGRAGAAWPNGQVAISSANSVCNSGTVDIPWLPPGSTGPMGEDHPQFAFMMVSLAGDRLVQVSDRSFVKHAFLSINGSQGSCGTCLRPPPPAMASNTLLYVGCSDAYGSATNGDRFWLGPPDEIDPWLGTWNRVGSYFDRGDPAVSGAAATDGVRSLTSAMTNAMGTVVNRVTIREQDLVVPGAQFFLQAQLVLRGESVALRADNLRTCGIAFGWNGTSWSAATVGPSQQNGVLDRWPGATLGSAGNGLDDGRFRAAVKVTGPVAGLWHYEYAVHNVDNQRGAAALRIPVCAAARVLNPGFHDVDDDALNEWLATVGNGEIAFTAPANNPQDWNTLFNFWFDSDAAPVAGLVTIDQARLGPGALSVQVASSVPGFVPNVHLGGGCGAPAVAIQANGVPAIPNLAFAAQVRTSPATGVIVFFSWGGASLPLGGGCTQRLDSASLGTIGFLLTDPTGLANLPLAIPPGVAPGTLHLQAISLVPGSGALLGAFNLSNGLGVRIGGFGCP